MLTSLLKSRRTATNQHPTRYTSNIELQNLKINVIARLGRISNYEWMVFILNRESLQKRVDKKLIIYAKKNSSQYYEPKLVSLL